MARSKWRVTDILAVPFIWRFFRKTIDVFGGIYRTRMSVLREFGLTPQMSIVDIACGTGQYSRITDGTYLGIDMDPNYIADAQRRFGNGKRTFLCADANRAPIADAAYDAALLIDATHHLTDDENRALFKTLGRVASQRVVFCDPVRQSRRNWIGRFLTALDRGRYIRPEEELVRLVQESLAIEKIQKTKLMGVEGVCILARPHSQTPNVRRPTPKPAF